MAAGHFHSTSLIASAMANSNEAKTAISPRRDQDFPEWYQQVIRAAELAESSDVRGCMVIGRGDLAFGKTCNGNSTQCFGRPAIATPIFRFSFR